MTLETRYVYTYLSRVPPYFNDLILRIKSSTTYVCIYRVLVSSDNSDGSEVKGASIPSFSRLRPRLGLFR